MLPLCAAAYLCASLHTAAYFCAPLRVVVYLCVPLRIAVYFRVLQCILARLRIFLLTAPHLCVPHNYYSGACDRLNRPDLVVGGNKTVL